jgi:hypothetical protein
MQMPQVSFDDMPPAVHFMSQIGVLQRLRFSCCQEKMLPFTLGLDDEAFI